MEQQSLQQCLPTLPLREGGRGRSREALCARALRLRVVRVLPAVLWGRPREEEELLQVPVALRNGRVAEFQPLSNHAFCVGGLDAAL